jgi:hypothetical protein
LFLTGHVGAIIKYESERLGYQNSRFSTDLAYIRDHVDKTLMRLIEHPPAEPSKAKGEK